MQIDAGMAVAVVALAVVGGLSLWFAHALGKGKFQLINGYEPEKVKDAAGLRRLMRACYSITGWALLVSACAILATRALVLWLFSGLAVAGVSLGFMTAASTKHYRL
ncbi:MAG: hypothetical protein BWY85_01817 [Firmicutes bacterium ADurb.Bin506]|jgi:hypothetical protein|nr:MAG: hypothetical protein BWY85_01817 [Firmicutes bacterium ADurb.Bin506]